MGRKKKGTPRGPKRGKHGGRLHKTELVVADVDVAMVKRYLDINFMRTIAELKEIHRNPKTAFAEASVVAVMLKIYNTGDIYALNALYDRLIGPVLRRISVTGERPYEQWSMQQLLAEKMRLDKENTFTVRMIEKEQRLVAAVASGNYDRDKCQIIDVGSGQERTDKADTA